MAIELNSDMGEAFGIYDFGADEALMEHVDLANVACGFHGGDPVVLQRTVRLASEHGVRVGAHPSYPDLAGFGRRAMTMERAELAATLIYQVGALRGFVDAEGMALSHLKPHGALYGAAARDRSVAEAVADAAAVFGLPVMGMPGTLHETVYAERGLEFWAEYYADLDYDDDGGLIITRKHVAYDPAVAAERVARVVGEGVAVSAGGRRSRCGPTRCACIRTRRGRRNWQRRWRRCSMARTEVVSPVPGTFFRRPDPDSDPFFSDGDTVSAGDVIGLVEIMKNFQDVEAEVDGTLVEFLVGNEDAVQAGQAVAVIDDGS